MITLLGCTVLLILSTLIALLRPVYASISKKESARRVKKGNKKNVAMHEIVAYGTSVDTVLFVMTSTLSSVAFLLLALRVNVFLAVFAIIASSYVLYFFAPNRVFTSSSKLAYSLSPYLVALLQRLSPLLKKKPKNEDITEIYEKEDLLELLQIQKSKPANRIEAVELELAGHALTFADKKVSDYMIPRKKLHMVNSEDPVGPILLTELHDSGYTCFPVHNQHEDTIVGTLFLKDLVERRATGIVSNVMSPAVFYVNQAASLSQVLAAFTKTKHHIFIVVNDAVEIVGAITIEDALEQVTGHRIEDDFDNYEDISRVASSIQHSKK